MKLNDVAGISINTHFLTVAVEASDSGAPKLVVSILVDHDDENEVRLEMDPIAAASLSAAIAEARREQERRIRKAMLMDEESAASDWSAAAGEIFDSAQRLIEAHHNGD